MLPFTIAIIALVGMAGLSVDAVLGTIVKSKLGAAVDGALLAAARAPEDQMNRVVDSVFNANFRPGYMMVTSRAHSPLAYNPTTGEISMSGQANLPTLFMRVFGQSEMVVTARGVVRRPVSVPKAEILIIDEDTMDTDVPSVEAACPESQLSKCINDDIADPGVRTPLFTRQTLPLRTPYPNLVLPAGQVGDEGVFRFPITEDGWQTSQTSLQNGATFTVYEFLTATGAAADENNLDKIEDVVPLYDADLHELVGKTVCAVAFDSDVSVDHDAHFASLKGATLGVVAFTVNYVEAVSWGNSVLPRLQVTMADTDATCGNPLNVSMSVSEEDEPVIVE